MTSWQLSPGGLYVPPDAADGAYLALKDGVRFSKFGRLVAGAGTTPDVDATSGDVAVNVGLTSADGSVDITDNGDGTLDLAAVGGGGGGGGTYHGCSASRTTNQSITATGAAIQFDAADEWDTDSIHDPSSNNTRFTIPAGLGGFWLFSANVQWPSSSLGRGFSWAKNGVRYSDLYRAYVVSASSSSYFGVASTTLQVAAGDYIECIAAPSAAGTISAARLTCHYLGA